MIKYFGKSVLKQAIRNKPIRFGFKSWGLSTVSGYVICFELYQGCFLHFIINNEIIHRFWDSAKCEKNVL
jgi:hypothetical protein